MNPSLPPKKTNKQKQNKTTKKQPKKNPGPTIPELHPFVHVGQRLQNHNIDSGVLLEYPTTIGFQWTFKERPIHLQSKWRKW